MKRRYSLLLMSNTGGVRRMGISSTMLHFLLLLCVLLPLLVAVLLWGGWKLCEINTALRAEKAALQAEIKECKEVTARLGSLEQFLYENDPELLKMVLGPAFMAERFKPSPESSASVKSDAGEQSGAAVQPEAQTPAVQSSDLQPAEHTAELQTGSSVKPDLPVEAQAEPYREAVSVQEKDLGVVELKNVKARMSGSRSMRVSFDLYNKKEGSALSGHVELELHLKNGTVIPLNDGSEPSYRINRLRKMVSNLLLPSVVELDGARVLIRIFAGDDPVFVKFYELEQ